MSKVITARDGKKYLQDQYGSIYPLHEPLTQSEPSGQPVQETRPTQPSVSGKQAGSWGGDNTAYVDSEEYRAKHFNLITPESAEVLNNWSANHGSRPLPPTKLPEELVREQIEAGDRPELLPVKYQTPNEQQADRTEAAIKKTNDLVAAAEPAESAEVKK